MYSAYFVGQIDDRDAEAPLVAVAVEEVVVAHGDVEEIARRDARRIVIVVLGSGGGDLSRSFEPYCDAGHSPVGLMGVVGVASTLPQKSPAWNC